MVIAATKINKVNKKKIKRKKQDFKYYMLINYI